MAKPPKTPEPEKEEINEVKESTVPDQGPVTLASPPDFSPVAVASVKMQRPPDMRVKLTRANQFYYRRVRSLLKSLGKI